MGYILPLCVPPKRSAQMDQRLKFLEAERAGHLLQHAAHATAHRTEIAGEEQRQDSEDAAILQAAAIVRAAVLECIALVNSKQRGRYVPNLKVDVLRDVPEPLT